MQHSHDHVPSGPHPKFRSPNSITAGEQVCKHIQLWRIFYAQKRRQLFWICSSNCCLNSGWQSSQSQVSGISDWSVEHQEVRCISCLCGLIYFMLCIQDRRENLYKDNGHYYLLLIYLRLVYLTIEWILSNLILCSTRIDWKQISIRGLNAHSLVGGTILGSSRVLGEGT